MNMLNVPVPCSTFAQASTLCPVSGFLLVKVCACCLLTHWKCVPLLDLLNGLLWVGQNGLPPTPDTLYLGCRYYLHSSHRFFFFSLGVKDGRNSKHLLTSYLSFTMNSCSHIFSLSKISMETERYFVSFTTMHNEKLWCHFFFHFLRSQWKQKDIFKIIDNGQL